jgi:hypothetical protein
MILLPRGGGLALFQGASVLQGSWFRVVERGVLGLGLIIAYYCHDFALRGRKFRAVERGVLGLGLIGVYVYYDFALEV